MAVVRWDPWGELSALQRDVNELFGRTFGQSTRRATALVPPIDAYQSDAALVVRMELPGMRPEDVEVSVTENQITVSGERRTDEKVEDDRWIRRERALGRFERAFTLPQGTDPAKITATFEYGVLELEIPHPAEKQPRKIEVSAARPDVARQTLDVSEASAK